MSETIKRGNFKNTIDILNKDNLIKIESQKDTINMLKSELNILKTDLRMSNKARSQLCSELKVKDSMVHKLIEELNYFYIREGLEPKNLEELYLS